MAPQPVGFHSARFPSSRCACIALEWERKRQWERRKEKGKRHALHLDGQFHSPPGPPPFQHYKTFSLTLKWRTLVPLLVFPTLHHRAGMIAAKGATTYLSLGQSNPTLERAQERGKAVHQPWPGKPVQPHRVEHAPFAQSSRLALRLFGGSAGEEREGGKKKNVAESLVSISPTLFLSLALSLLWIDGLRLWNWASEC